MQELIKYVESKHLKPKVTDCRIGDTVRVMVKVKEGTGKDERTRLQAYEGVVIARTGGGINESLRVRRVTHGIGVERVFPLHSPIIEEILTVRHGKVRRSKLYYLRTRVGKKARVPEQSRDVVAARETARKELEAAEAAAAAAAIAAAAAATAEESAE